MYHSKQKLLKAATIFVAKSLNKKSSKTSSTSTICSCKVKIAHGQHTGTHSSFSRKKIKEENGKNRLE